MSFEKSNGLNFMDKSQEHREAALPPEALQILDLDGNVCYLQTL
jgi:hypothetical protein